MTNPLYDRAMLAQLNITQWTAKKHDKKVSAEATAHNHAKSNTGEFRKKLLPMNSALEAVHSKTNDVRNRFFYGQTLPWGNNGARLLASTNYMEFTSEYRKLNNTWLSLVERFLNTYENARSMAAFSLGNMYRPEDYPSLEKVRAKFSMALEIDAVPATDFRCLPSSLPQAEIDALSAQAESRVLAGQATAERALWDRLRERVQHIADKTATPDGKFQDSMIEGTEETCLLLPKLNFNDNEALNMLCAEVRTHLCKNDPKVIRVDLLARNDTHEQAMRILTLIEGAAQ